MKIKLSVLAAVMSAFLVLGCDTPSDPQNSKPVNPEPELPQGEPDLELPGDVESVQFEIPNIPDGVSYVYIYRKYNTDEDYTFYSWVNLNSPKEDNLIYNDPYVDAGKTYRYKYSYYESAEKIVNVEIDNNGTKNFTPATGIGELKYKDGLPTSTYNTATKELVFSDKLVLSPVIEEINGYSKAISFWDKTRYLYTSINYDYTTFNLETLFEYAAGKFDITSIGPAVLYYNPEEKINIYYQGKKYDISEKNITMYYSVGVNCENTDEGMMIYTKRFRNESWNFGIMEIYEDDVSLNMFYVLDPEPGEVNHFLFPFTKKGTTYKFVLNKTGNSSMWTTIVANKTTNLQLDAEKLKNHLTDADMSFDSSTKILKCATNPKDIFNKTDTSTLKYLDYVVYIFDTDDNGSFIYNHYDDFVNEGVDLSEIVNVGKNYTVQPYIRLCAEEYSEKGPFLYIPGKETILEL